MEILQFSSIFYCVCSSPHFWLFLTVLLFLIRVPNSVNSYKPRSKTSMHKYWRSH